MFLKLKARGYGGTVRVMTGISSEGEITGVVVLSHSETRAWAPMRRKRRFRNQYKQAAPESGIEIVKYQTPQRAR